MNLAGIQRTLAKVVEPSGLYLVLAGNANTLDVRTRVHRRSKPANFALN